jgi:hypothetical protein
MSTAAPGVQAPPRAGFGAGRILVVVLGSLVALLGFALLAGGATLAIVNATERDGDGYFTTSTERFATSGYALTHDGVELFDTTTDSDWEEELGDLATLRVRVSSDEAVFAGIAPTADVERYLADVGHSLVDDVDYDPFRVDYVRHEGGAPGSPPGHEGFWSAIADGTSDVTLTWPIEPGTWSLVVMNADGSRAVSADVQFGAKVQHLGWLALGLALAGIVLATAGGALVFAGARRPPGAGGPLPAVAADEASPYPTRVEAELDPGLGRWLWLVKWLLAIPHYVVLAFLWLAVVVVSVIAWFAILFTGRYPRGLFEYTVGVLRWTWRVGFYAYGVNGTDRYPPFTLADVPDYPATLDVPYPERLSRGLVLVKSWLLAIPHLIVVGIIFGTPSLNFVLVLVASVILLFTARYPSDIFELVVGFNRWAFRVAAYVLLLRDEYPPFRLRS